MIGEISNAFLTKNVPNGGRASGLAFSHRKIHANGVTQPCRRDTPGSFRVPAGAQNVVRLTPSVLVEAKSLARFTRSEARLAQSVAGLTQRDARQAKSIAADAPSEALDTFFFALDTLRFDGGGWGCHEAGFYRLHGR